jgi:hypothetical protein
MKAKNKDSLLHHSNSCMIVALPATLGHPQLNLHQIRKQGMSDNIIKYKDYKRLQPIQNNACSKKMFTQLAKL